MTDNKTVKIEGVEYDIPSSWSIKKFGDVFHRRSETTKTTDIDNNIYVGLENIEKSQPFGVSYIEKAKEKSSNRVFRSGDVLFGKLAPDLEKSAIVDFSGVCSSDIIPIYASDKSSEEYLAYLLHTEFFLKRAISTMEGTNLPRTRWKDIANLRIPLPPIQEQNRIVENLNVVTDLIKCEYDIHNELNRTENGLAPKLFSTGIGDHDLVSAKVGPRNIKIPKNWELMEISDLLDSNVDRPVRGGPRGAR